MSVFTNPASAAAEAASAYVRATLDLLGDRDPIDVLDEQPDILARVLEGLEDEALRRPEAPGKWSILDVLGHLADSELVWAYRLRMVVAYDRPRLGGYDQDLWANRLRYREQPIQRSLARIRLLRSENLSLLASLEPADWDRVSVHQERGEESVRHMVRLYAGHDLIHRRQIERIRKSLALDD